MSNVPGNHSLRVPALKRLLPVVAVAAAFCVLSMGLPAAATPANPEGSQAQLSASVSPTAPTISQAFTSQQQTSWTVNDSPSLYGPSQSWWKITNYSVSAEGYGSHYHYTYSIGGDSSRDNWAQWDMGSRVGRQQINVYVPKRNATATVKYRIYKSGSLIAQPTLNQQQAYGWYNLGTYNFDDGTVSIVVNDNEAFPHYDNCSNKSYCKIGIDALRMKCVSNCTTATLPETPRGLYAVAGGAGELVVRWSAPSDDGGSALLGYSMIYYINSGNGNDSRTIQLGSSANSYTLTGLNNNTTYLIGLAAFNSVGTGLNAVTTATTGAAVTAPDRPRYLRVDANDDGSLTVKWTVPESVGGAPVTRYRVSYGNSSTAYRNVYVNATGGNDDIHFDHTITGLDEGTSYSIHVYATNSAGESAAATTTGTTVAGATLPETPRGLYAVAGDAGELVVRWSAPSDDGGSPLLGYRMTYYIDPEGSNNPRTLQVGSGATSYTLTGLVDDTKYLIGLAAFNSVGTGLNAVTTATTGAAVTAPDRPRYLRVDANDDGSLTVKWTVPESVGGAPVTRYRVSYGNSSTAYRNVYVNATGGNDDIHFDHTITGLDEGTSYSIHVYATNSAGESAAATTTGTTVASSGSPGTPTGVRAVAHGERQIRVSWSAPSQSGGSLIKHYRVQYSRPAIGNGRGWTGTATVAGTSHISGNLRQGVTYTVRVTAVNQDDRASSPASATATTKAASGVPPSSPRNVRAVAHGEKQIRVSWSAPSQSGSSAIKHYRVQYSRPAIGNGRAWTGTATVAGTSHISGNLRQGVTYTVRVTAVNQDDRASSPASATATTKAASGVPPSSPRNVRAVAHGEKQIRVSWSAPSQSGGSAIKHYRVQYSRPAIGSRPAWSGTATVTGTSNTSGNLLQGVTYTVRVTAVNQSGKSSSPASAKATVAGGARVELTAEDSNRLNTLVNLSTKLQNNVDILNPYQLPQRVDSGYNYFSEAVSIAKRSLKPAGQCCFSWQTGYSETPTRSSATIAGRVERQLRMIYENYNNVLDRWLTAAISDKQRDINIGRGVIDQSNFNVERWRQVVHNIDRNLIAPISIHLGKTYAPQKNLWLETNSSLSTLFRCLNDVITYNRNRRAPWDTVVHLWRDAFGQTPNCEDAAESLADQLVALAGKIGKEAFNRAAERAEGYIEDRVKQKALSEANRKAVVRKAVNSALAQGAKKLVAAIGAWEGGVELGCVATGLVRILQTARWSTFSQGYGDACGSAAAQWLRPLTTVTEEHLDWTILPRL